MSPDWDTRPPPIDDTGGRRSRRRSRLRRVLIWVFAVSGATTLLLVVALGWMATRHAAESEAGRAFAAEATQEECVDEALGRLEACTSMACASAESAFLGACLMAAAESPSLCEGVPEGLVGQQTVAWAVQRCRGVDAPQAYCSLVLGALLGECLGPRDGATAEEGS